MSGAAEPTVYLAGGAEPTARLAATGFDPDATVAGSVASRTVSAFTEPTVAGATASATVGGSAAGASGGGSLAATTVAPSGETRFGPGVPAGPPPGPAWPQPGSGPARRSRSVWRRVVSVLSTLLTVALLVAVGLFIWQRLSPLEIQGVTVAVSDPPGNRCDVTVEVAATVRTNGNAGTIRYQWLRSGSPPGALVSERVGRGQRTVSLPLKWSFTGVGTVRETATINIVEPSVTQAGTEVRYTCRRR
ncbi:hypothetical protein [Micromonospora sp. ATCC 39149]|uniref:hypothetical protein n=1 Tax=Micromonospora sp. (strain ATCC 39149 / NRRL 15099 / SCC 1413) TaxID=219305 RepID=UPI0002F298F1|nr:hypothetical protein [Micromonospora sp. ATCC 39149]